MIIAVYAVAAIVFTILNPVYLAETIICIAFSLGASAVLSAIAVIEHLFSYEILPNDNKADKNSIVIS